MNVLESILYDFETTYSDCISFLFHSFSPIVQVASWLSVLVSQFMIHRSFHSLQLLYVTSLAGTMALGEGFPDPSRGPEAGEATLPS